jgi:hypothetical protein
MDWNGVDTAELIKRYCAANTANALYEGFSTMASVTDALASCGTEQVVAELHGLLSQPVSIDRNARAYALVVVLALYSPQTARKVVLEGDIDALRWGQAVVNAADAKHRTTDGRRDRLSGSNHKS